MTRPGSSKHAFPNGVLKARGSSLDSAEHAELHFIETLTIGVVHIEARVPSWALPEPAESIRMGDGSGRVWLRSSGRRP